ncbi:hypothetical protein AgCh_012094 [Apium graveolens]
MVDISDIPQVGKIVDRISDATVDPIFRRFCNLFCYKDLVNVLIYEIEKVYIQKGRVSRKVIAERADGKTIEDHVLKWRKEVDDIQESAKELSGINKNRASWREFSDSWDLYGMPGVGKTRMMGQIWKEAKKKKIFDKVARADVGSE